MYEIAVNLKFPWPQPLTISPPLEIYGAREGRGTERATKPWKGREWIETIVPRRPVQH